MCNKLSCDGVFLENFGTVCRIQCPDCKSIRKLSSFTNPNTGKCTFSLSNFSRHHAMHNDATHSDGDEAQTMSDSDQRFHDVEMNESSNSGQIAVLRKELLDANKKLDQMRKELETKENTIALLKNRIPNMPSNEKVPKKRVEQLMFKINLCCFEAITDESIKFKSNAVQFKGKIKANIKLDKENV